jgi:hypothetical protein
MGVISESEKKKEDWMNSKWRPMMGWMYMIVCITDMVLFPIAWSLLQTSTGQPITQWNPLTLQGAGLFHISMGAVLGLTAWGRTQEKLGGVNNGGLQPVSQSVSTTSSPTPTGGSFGGSATPSFSSPSTPSSVSGGNFGSPSSTTSSFGATNTPAKSMMSNTGKPMPAQPDMPEL